MLRHRSSDQPAHRGHDLRELRRPSRGRPGQGGVDSVSVNLATERADIRLASPVDRMALIQAVEKVGYDVPAGTVELAVEA
jgi:hypothetical protein